MQRTIRVRIKLSDFIDTDYESEVMEMINKTHNDLRVMILLHLWYGEEDVKIIKLKDFLIRWEDKLHFKTVVKQNSSVNNDEFVFYDIIPKDVKQIELSRFSYVYNNKTQIVDGLKQLYDCVKFITEDKPSRKRQKRNDYED